MTVVELFGSLGKVCVAATDFAFCSGLATDLAFDWLNGGNLSIVDSLSDIGDSGTAGVGPGVFGHVELK